MSDDKTGEPGPLAVGTGKAPPKPSGAPVEDPRKESGESDFRIRDWASI